MAMDFVTDFFSVYYVSAVNKMGMLLIRFMLEGFRFIQLRMIFGVSLIVVVR